MGNAVPPSFINRLLYLYTLCHSYLLKRHGFGLRLRDLPSGSTLSIILRFLPAPSPARNPFIRYIQWCSGSSGLQIYTIITKFTAFCIQNTFLIKILDSLDKYNSPRYILISQQKHNN